MATRPQQKSSVSLLKGTFESKSNPFAAGSDNILSINGAHFDEHGSLTKWRGIERLSTAQINESGTPAKFTGLFPWNLSSGSNERIAVSTGGVYRWGSPTALSWNGLIPAGPAARASASTDLCSAIVYNDVMYVCDGVSNNFKLLMDTTTTPATCRLWNWGVAAPGTTCTATDAGVGIMAAGTYSYKVCFYNSKTGEESDPSAKSNDVTIAANRYINLTSIPVATDPQVDKRRIYRTASSGATWLYLTTINDNTTTTYTDNNSDNALGISINLTDATPPPVLSDVEVFRGYAFAVGPNSSRVYISKYGFPHGFDLVNDYRDCDANDGDTVVGIKRLYTNVIVYKKNSIWTSTGDSLDNFGFVRTATGVGAVNKQCILQVPTENSHIFMGKNGYFYKFTGSKPDLVNIGMQKWLKDNLAAGYIGETVGFLYPSRNLMCWLIVTGQSTTKNYMVVYDYVTEQWGLRALNGFTGNVAQLFTEPTGEEAFYVMGTDGWTRAIGSGFSDDDGDAITMEIIDRGHPKENQGELIAQRKSFNAIHAFFKPYEGLRIKVYYSIDQEDGDYVYAGEMHGDWTSGNDHVMIAAIGRRLFVKFVHDSLGPECVIRGWMVEYKVIGRDINA